MQIHCKFLSLIILAFLLSACTSSSRYAQSEDTMPSDYQNFDASKIPNATPRVEPLSRSGNPESYVVLGKRYYVLKSAKGYKERGIASFYGVKFHNYKTSNGEIYNMYGMTAANKILPLPTYVKVTNLQNQRWVIVRVNDRGPFHVNRIIDLSFAAAKKLDMIAHGTALVEVEAMDPHHLESARTSGITHKTLHKGTPQVYLQLGAFADQHNAIRLEAKLHQYTQRPIRIISGHGKGRTLYRVQIGPVKDVEEADSLTETFKKHGLGDAFAVVD